MSSSADAGGWEETSNLVRRVLDASQPGDASEGLRDRKKRELRQRISDTATGMFLMSGFDEVKVSDVAAACDVSEKTVYNYFPTKESLLFDQEDATAAQIREALEDTGDDASLIDSVVAVLEADVNRSYDRWRDEPVPGQALTVVRDFARLIENTPALLLALHGMTARLTAVAAEALAERVGVDPDDPEPQQAAVIILGLWQTQLRAMVRHADGDQDIEDVRRAVIDDIRRAASVAEGGLASFNLVVSRSNSKEQLLEAAKAADDARRQMFAAVKQARSAWKQVVTEIQSHAGKQPGDHHASHQEVQRVQREMREEIRRRQREVRQRQAELRKTKNQARADVRRDRHGPGRPGPGRPGPGRPGPG
jgi:AcrR family transcriptional regulator/flagellar biosynthesis regulator FlaF